MSRAIRDLQHAFQRRGLERRLRQRRPTVESLEERALLSAAPHHLGTHGIEAAKAKKAVPGYLQTNLVSDGAVSAQVTDTNLKNPWGMAFSPTTSSAAGGPFWISDAGSSKATIYTVDPTTGAVTKASLVVTIPSGGSPTGQVFNTTSDFQIPGTGKAAVFIFDTLQGSIAAWNGGTTAVNVHSDTSDSYTGLALGNKGGKNFLYLANEGSSPGISVYDTNFTEVTGAGTFVDPKLSKGSAKKLNFEPYNVQNINGQLFVAYRSSKSPTKAGAVAVFNTDGTFVRQISSNSAGGHLAAPWGLAMAPANFGKFSNALLVGNFGDGRINAFNPTSGKFLGQVSDIHKKPIVNSGLWAISFGNGGKAGSPSILYFDAGINNQSDGLFGSLQAVTS
jgi:uncharacterized protein (TIGR03118 family)